jgi:hypothetical protein
MWALFSRYYEGTSEKIFRSDLEKKWLVIMLYEKGTATLKGFSTQALSELTVDGEKMRILYSGDTVIDEAFWGSGTLQIAFSLLMLKLKLKRPWGKLNWFLITKGYKTYLLLSNNFKDFWPRFDQKTPEHVDHILSTYAQLYFGKSYHRAKGLLIFSGEHEHLKKGVAPIREKDLKNPHIRYFLERNPGWEKGDELVCLGEFDLGLPLRVLKKKIFRF